MRPLILIVHGAGEHSGRYEYVATQFVQQGYTVAALDLPGHGKSSGTRCYVEKFDNFSRAVQLVRQQLGTDYPGRNVILIGHSMGGLIASFHLLEHQSDYIACILSGPAIKSDLQPGWFQMGVIRLLSAIAPKLGVLQLDASGVSRDPAVVERYLADPLVYNGKLTARLILEMFRAMTRVTAQVGSLRLPLLFMHGEKDLLVSPQSSRFMQEHAGSSDKTLKIYPSLYHEIFNEPEKDQVIGDAIAWCNRHTG